MGYNKGVITEPVSIRDIQRALGVSITDLGLLCKHANINKWAMYKPEQLAPLSFITMAQRRANYFGLTPACNDKAKLVAYGYNGSDAKNVGATGYSINEISGANLPWPYTKPIGGNTSPYRQTDFASDRDRVGAPGYRHDARPPIFGWTDWELFYADVERIANASIVPYIYNDSTDPTEWKVDNFLYDGTFYNAISGRLSENSASQFGGAGSDMIPVAWLLGGVATEKWRIGIGVFLSDGGGGEDKMHIITSCYPMKYLVNATSIQAQGPVFPALCTNQFLCKKMIAALGSSSTVTFSAIPLLVRNCIQTVGQLDGGQQTLVSLYSSDTLIYSVPSNSTTITITLRNETKPDIQGMNTISDSETTDGTFILATYGTGQYAGSGSSASITPIIGLGIFLTDNHSFTGTKTLIYDVDYSYGMNNQSRSYGHISNSVSITNSNVISTSSGDRVGVTIAVAPALSVTDFERLIYQT